MPLPFMYGTILVRVKISISFGTLFAAVRAATFLATMIATTVSTTIAASSTVFSMIISASLVVNVGVEGLCLIRWSALRFGFWVGGFVSSDFCAEHRCGHFRDLTSFC